MAATKKSKGNVKVGKLKVNTTKVKTNELKKVKGGSPLLTTYDIKAAKK